MTASGTVEDGQRQHGSRKGGNARRRSIARLAAVQALYQLELNPGRGADAVVGEFINHRLGREIDGDVYGEADEALFREIVRGLVADRERIDEAISAVLSDEWPMARLETLLRLILEAGAYELIHRPDIPPRVTISEYVSIAYAFFTGKEPSLANGVLDWLARALRLTDL
ncbi:MAG TPA: transcription antitermination factor NusB [Stellaceae bacterium]|nr:transcription antitermination factor NusB [Stellaceae bacterium]